MLAKSSAFQGSNSNKSGAGPWERQARALKLDSEHLALKLALADTQQGQHEHCNWAREKTVVTSWETRTGDLSWCGCNAKCFSFGQSRLHKVYRVTDWVMVNGQTVYLHMINANCPYVCPVLSFSLGSDRQKYNCRSLTDMETIGMAGSTIKKGPFHCLVLGLHNVQNERWFAEKVIRMQLPIEVLTTMRKICRTTETLVAMSSSG